MEHEFRANRTPGEALYLHDDKDGWYGGQVHFVARLIGGDSSRLKLELEKDVIVRATASGTESPASPTVVKLPNPKNEAELFGYQFNSVYDQSATQQEIFEKEGRRNTRGRKP